MLDIRGDICHSEIISPFARFAQKAFGAYLDALDTRAAQVCDGNYAVNYVEKATCRLQICPFADAADAACACEEESEVSLRDILQATGASLEQAEQAATIIQVRSL